MQWFSKEGLQAWREKMPDDVLECIAPIDDEGQAAADFIAQFLGGLNSPEDFLKVIEDHQQKFIDMGRSRRIRFLAWCSAKFYSHKETRLRLINAITETGSGDEGDDTDSQAVGIMFLEDIKAFAEAIGPRAALLIVDENTLSTVAGVGLDVASDLEMRGGR